MKKFILVLSLVLAMSFGAAAPVYAAQTDNTARDTEGYATFDEINADDVFIKQSARGRCTLASAAMILRRAAMLMGDEDWESITESSVAYSAWTSCGLGWEFTYDGITMVHDYVSSTEDLKALLEEHPEGIVAYDTWTPHAIALTDYDEETDTFYCSDPSEACACGRYDMSGSMISIDNVSAVWYVSSPEKLTLKEEVQDVVYEDLDEILSGNERLKN